MKLIDRLKKVALVMSGNLISKMPPDEAEEDQESMIRQTDDKVGNVVVIGMCEVGNGLGVEESSGDVEGSRNPVLDNQKDESGSRTPDKEIVDALVQNVTASTACNGVATDSDTDPGEDNDNAESASESEFIDYHKLNEEDGAASDIEERRELDRNMEIGSLNYTYERNQFWFKKEKRKRRKKKRERHEKSRRRKSQDERNYNSESQQHNNTDILPVEGPPLTGESGSDMMMMRAMEDIMPPTINANDLSLPPLEDNDNSVQLTTSEPSLAVIPSHPSPVHDQDIDTEKEKAPELDEAKPTCSKMIKVKKTGKRPKPTNWMWKYKARRRRRPKNIRKVTKPRSNTSSKKNVLKTPTLTEETHENMEEISCQNATDESLGYIDDGSIVYDDEPLIETPEEVSSPIQDEVVVNAVQNLEMTGVESVERKRKKSRRPANWMWKYPRRKLHHFRKRKATGGANKSKAKRSRMDAAASLPPLPFETGEAEEAGASLAGNDNVETDVSMVANPSMDDPIRMEDKRVEPTEKTRILYKCPFCFLIYSDSDGLIQHLPVHSKKTQVEDLSACSQNSDNDGREATGSVTAEDGTGNDLGNVRTPNTLISSSVSDDDSSHIEFCNSPEKESSKTNGDPDDIFEPTYVCKICGQEFALKYSLSVHKRYAHSKRDKTSHSSPGPEPSTSSKEASVGLQTPPIKPRLTERSKRIKCEQCGGTFSNLFNLKRHMQLHDSTRKFKCSLCSCYFRSRFTRYRHGLRLHPSSRTKIAGNRKEAKLSRTKVRIHKPRSLKGSEIESDEMINGKSIPNGMLPEKTKTARKNNEPVLNNDGWIPQIHTCYRCGMGFTLKCNLAAHMKYTHGTSSKRARDTGGEMDRKCNVCGKLLSSIYAKILHMRIHTDQKAFKCAKCNYSCRQISNLSQHEKFHDSRRPWPCSQCQLYFQTNNGLRTHIRVMHREKGQRAPKNYPLAKVSKLPPCQIILTRCDNLLPRNDNQQSNADTGTISKSAGREKPETNKRKARQEARINIMEQTVSGGDDDVNMDDDREFSHGEDRSESGTQSGKKIKKGVKSKHKLGPDPLNLQSIVPPGNSANPNKKLYKCSICPKAYASTFHLRDHLRSHSQTPHKCHICSRVYSLRQGLNQHVREVHMGIKRRRK